MIVPIITTILVILILLLIKWLERPTASLKKKEKKRVQSPTLPRRSACLKTWYLYGAPLSLWDYSSEAYCTYLEGLRKSYFIAVQWLCKKQLYTPNLTCDAVVYFQKFKAQMLNMISCKSEGEMVCYSGIYCWGMFNWSCLTSEPW